MLQVHGLNVKLGDLTLADDMSFSLKPGDINVIIGPNGTGKSTLLKTLFGDITTQSGEIVFNQHRFDDTQLSVWRERIGYMPQDIRLDVSLSVVEVVLLGRLDALSWRIDDKMLTEAVQALDDIGLAHLANRDVRTLSGGQCQMVLFAQAILRRPEFLMLDEPVSALDLHFQQVMLEHLVRKTRETHWTSVMVLHDLNLASQYADNLLVLKDGQVVSSGRPDRVLTPELIKNVYGVTADVSYDGQGIPFVRTQRACAI
ncbi:ABC transporter ATP-binding protein [Vibrio palustris]|uniref:Hemin import ATP-binding protein HmuV n=1 Tax=Vibrio palustris TaxID=1918946 RepID=A0A1R4B352_9VIBR|nr:ABC transporter ATP-binding protein [Vibrio palustris]SJL83350.1 Hemin import ATP-binding protein HmuV [Vibrio palustris]